MKLQLALGLGRQSQRPKGVPDNDMILVYEIPSASTNIELPIQANSTWFSAGQEVVIDWGDGSDTTVSATSGHTGYIGHTYADAGTYTIKISGSMNRYGLTSSSITIAGRTLLTRVDSFGQLGITSLQYAFLRCTGLTSVPKTLPSSVAFMVNMFTYCCRGTAFNPDVSNWDMSNVTDISNMFYYCDSDAFNPDVSNWDVSNVENMNATFYRCGGAAFNPNVSNWNVSNVKDMSYMFSNCSGDAFNPDVSNWNVSSVEDMRSMFYFCYGDAFNPDMKSWTLKTGLRTGSMLYVAKTQSAEWLDELLIAWAANPNQGNNITIKFYDNSYTEVDGEPLPEVAAALATLRAKGWSITTANS